MKREDKDVPKSFATDRAMHDLGRVVKERKDRHRLCRGGYYFFDMDQYHPGLATLRI